MDWNKAKQALCPALSLVNEVTFHWRHVPVVMSFRVLTLSASSLVVVLLVLVVLMVIQVVSLVVIQVVSCDCCCWLRQTPPLTRMADVGKYLVQLQVGKVMCCCGVVGLTFS